MGIPSFLSGVIIGLLVGIIFMYYLFAPTLDKLRELNGKLQIDLNYANREIKVLKTLNNVDKQNEKS